MADRNVYGRDFSENGWRMVDQGSCVWVKVPGTTVSLQIREGQPAKILGAFVADWNAYIEPVYDADSACWTPTNSVASSNHLSGTACDVRWNSHPFQIANAGFNAAQIATMREMLKFYEDTVFWGNDWNSPKDAMHVQMGYNTYGSENVARVQRFIDTKIRADGFSTFRRGGTVTAPPPPPASNQVDILARATGVTQSKAQQILVGVVNGLRDSQCTNVNRVAMWLAQMGHESGGFNATEEYASGAAYEGRKDLGNTQSGDGVRFKGRSWIQVTGRSNYTQLSKWANTKGIVDSPTFFVDNPTKLAEMQYAGLGPAWYWTVARPQINALSDARNLISVTQAINGGQNGAADRKTRYDRALALGDQLLALTTAAPPQTPGDDMALVPQAQWDAFYQAYMGDIPSLSPLRKLGEGNIGPLHKVLRYIDANTHVPLMKLLAGLGHPDTLRDLQALAAADLSRYPDRADGKELANNILADLASDPQAVVQQATQELQIPAAPQVVYVDRPGPEPVANAVAVADEPSSTGQIIGKAYDALQQLRLADALPIEDRAPLAALISVLNTKNGSQL